jgi:uncharacterized protein
MFQRIVLSALLLLFAACSSVPPGMQRIHLQGENESVAVDVEVADTPEKEAKGLMFRTELPQNQGMLFVFAEPQLLYFWMKNTKIPLDILYFAADGSLVSTTTMEPCVADPCPSYPSAAPARYALEVNKGYVVEHGIDQTWKLVLPDALTQ